MHILYIHQYFATPKGSTGTRSYEFARRWVKAGHKVTLITANCDISGLEIGKGVIQKQTIEGIDVIIAGIKYSNKHSFIHRIASFLCFILFSIYAGLKVKNVDVIYATSTPLTVGIPAIALKWLKRIPFVFEVRDQWPAVPIGMGIIRNKILIKILLWLEKTIYKQSAAIVALSPGMADGVKESLKNINKKVEIVPNCSDTDRFHSKVDGNLIRKKYGWENKFILLHFGAMGKANGLDFLIDTASMLKEQEDIHFVIIGDGSEKDRLVKRKNSLNLNNIEFLGSISKNLLPQYVAACNVSTVIFADYNILEHNSANKFFDSLAAGKPVLLNYSGWQRDVLENANAGFGCTLYVLDEFVEKVNFLSNNKNTIKRMGENARQLAKSQFNRDILAEKVLCCITSVVKTN